MQAEGRPDLSFSGSDVNGSASVAFSCFGTAGAHVTLYRGESVQTAELGLDAITYTGIAEGATGSYRIDQAAFVVGADVWNTRGSATLEISRHDASSDPAARRVAGRIVGLNIVNPDGPDIPIEAEFDVNAACTPFER
jgi:hypothetical protein